MNIQVSKIFAMTLSLTATLWVSASVAQNSSAQMPSDSSAPSAPVAPDGQSHISVNKTPKDKFYNIELGFQDEAYMASPKDLNGYNNFQEIQGRAQIDLRGKTYGAYFDLGGSAATNVPDYNSYYVPEAYGVYKFGHSEISFGRRKQEWSGLDQYWQLGLWQPRYEWNYLHPIDEGLTGAFYQVHSGDFKFVAFASPLFIPSQGAAFSINNGSISSNSPWFIPPASTVQLFSGQANVHYGLVLPDTTRIVSQVSSAMSFTYEPKPYYARVSVGVMPRNDIATPVDGYLALNSSGSDAPVTIYPKVLYHELAALDIGRREKLWSVSLSSLAEIPTGQVYDPTLTYQQLSNQVLVSPSFDFAFTEGVFSPHVSLSFIKQFGGEVTEVGPLANPNSYIFSSPIDYREATQVRVAQAVYRGGNQKLDVSMKWVEELDEQSSELLTEVIYVPNQIVRLYLGADLLGSRADPNNPGFIARYRDNSLAYGGVGCTF